MGKIRFFIFTLFLTFIFFPIITSPPSAETEIGGGRISLIQGQVFIQAKDGEEWTEASVNFPVMEGDRIRTEQDGRVEIQFKNGTYVRMGEASQIDIIALNDNREKEIIHLNLLEGRIYVNHPATPGRDCPFYIDLPYGFFTAYGNSKFRVDLHPSEAKISVLEGSIEFKRYDKPILLVQGKTLILSEGGFSEVGHLYRGDEWDRWNEARDNELGQRRYAQRYLPPELEPWGYEMEGQGRWVYTPEYRYVWVPTLVVGWVPFRHGYWTWRRGIYCWVPYEPWGWIPFHYGRWVYIHIHGWVWVPPIRHTLFWHPGAVGWYIGPTHISWVPLAPGEVYYGYGYYGPYSVNITRVNINIQKNVYINAQAKDAVVTVHKDFFFKGNQVAVVKIENPFLRPSKISGPPAEKPVALERKGTPFRPVKEFVEKDQQKIRSSPSEGMRHISSIAKEAKLNETKHVSGNSEMKPIISDSTLNHSEKIGQPKPQEMVKKKDSFPPIREVTKVERSSPIDEDKGKSSSNNSQTLPIQERIEKRNLSPFPMKTPPNTEPKNFRENQDRNALGDIGRNQAEKRNQPNSIQSLPQPREEKVLNERQSLPGGGLFSTSDSKGQAIPQHRGTKGGLFEGFPGKSFR